MAEVGTPDAPDPIRAAGAVVWRPGPDGPQIVLVHRPRYDDWSYPKGKSGRGEHVLLAAAREVAEETGLRVVLGRRLAPSVYEFAGRRSTSATGSPGASSRSASSLATR